MGLLALDSVSLTGTLHQNCNMIGEAVTSSLYKDGDLLENLPQLNSVKIWIQLQGALSLQVPSIQEHLSTHTKQDTTTVSEPCVGVHGFIYLFSYLIYSPQGLEV